MSALTSTPGALRLFVVSIVARLPLAMLTIGMLVHVKGARGRCWSGRHSSSLPRPPLAPAAARSALTAAPSTAR